MKTVFALLAATLPAFGGPPPAAAADAARSIYDFESAFNPASVAATGTAMELVKTGTDQALRVTTQRDQRWPGVTLPAPEGCTDLSAFDRVALTVTNTGGTPVTVYCRVDNEGANGREHCVTGSVTVTPGAVEALRVELKRHSYGNAGGKLFGMRGYPAVPGGEGTVVPSRITRFVVFVSQPKEPHCFEIDDLRAEGVFTPPAATLADADPFLPFIDTFGQYRHRDWPGKVHSQAEMQEHRAAEERELTARPEPAGRNQWGGWAAGPQLEATGFFRTQKHRGKWWLVDPDGRLFFSHGIDCVRMTDLSPVEERRDWFENYPGDQPEFAEFRVPHAFALKGHYAGRSPACFAFASANLKRKYGDGWREVYPPLIHRRLRSWGLNTIGNWSDESTRLLRRTPYTDSIGSSGAKNIEGSDGYWGKFPDPFDESFLTALRRGMEGKKGRSAGDPWCTGFLSDNEMSWGDDTSLALAALKSPPEQAAKKTLLAALRSRYPDIAALNTAWGTAHESWDALLTSRTPPAVEKARADLVDFSGRVAEAYFRTVRDVIREYAPRQLYLGCRFAWVNARAAAAAAKYCDAVSYNLYQREVGTFQFNGGADVPLIIGEFHFGALDRGLFHTGLVPVASQAERASSYAGYVRSALRHPQFVGCHWFQFQDEPVTGRVYDEENYQIGFVDVTDTPYAETIAACREVAEEMYPLRAGQSAR